jgi:hypothetical protein
MLRRILKSVICALTALLAWAVLPGTFMDRGLFSLTARSFAESPFFITGKGSHDSAHTLRTLKWQATPPTDPLPDIAITDDPDRVFQASPPSPVDIAIILKNLRRLGRDSVAIGMPLAWSEPDVISLMALDQQLGALRSVVTAAPLSRGPIPSPLPPAFRQASIAVSEIHGNARHLPIVNRVSIPDVMLGNATSLAGFTALESEPDGALPYLLARWDDRVVFSFPLLAALADHKVPAANIEIRLGEYIALGTDGPFIPIDDFGRLAFAPPSYANPSSIPAETLIDAPADLLTGRRAGTVLVRNGMTAADEASARFSETLVPTVSLLADPSGISVSRAFNRMPWLSELLLIASLISLLHGLGSFPKAGGRCALTVFAGVFVLLHFIVVPGTGTWPPTLPALAAILAAIPLTAMRKTLPVREETVGIEPNPSRQPAFQLEIESDPAPLSPPKKNHDESAENGGMESAEENRETGGQDSPSEEDCPQTEGGARSCPEKSTLPLTADY